MQTSETTQDPGPAFPQQNYGVGWDLHLNWGCSTAEGEAIELADNYPFEDLMTWCVNCLSYQFTQDLQTDSGFDQKNREYSSN